MQNNKNAIRDQKYVFIIAGGGTGGHLFPGIAIARELEKRFKNAGILFVVGRRRMESDILSRYRYKVKRIDVEGIKGRGWIKGLSVVLRLPGSILQSTAIIKEFSPAIVFGVGGYSSGPLCLAARFMGIPTGIHEQNSYPGLTNRLLARVVDRVFISFEESREHFKTESLVLTGNPVREELFSGLARRDRVSGKFTILVMGGSQGARAVNRAFVGALAYLNSKGKKPDVIHQTGKADYQNVEEDYRKRGLAGELSPFIQDMMEAYGRADLVVSRAGATTIFELAALGKPSVLIPYPYAANQHQKTNARSLVRAGAAEMICESDLTDERLGEVLVKYMDNKALMDETGKRARRISRLDAAKVIVDHLEEMIL